MAYYKNKYNGKVKDFGTKVATKLAVIGWLPYEPEKEEKPPKEEPKNTKTKN